MAWVDQFMLNTIQTMAESRLRLLDSNQRLVGVECEPKVPQRVLQGPLCTAKLTEHSRYNL